MRRAALTATVPAIALALVALVPAGVAAAHPGALASYATSSYATKTPYRPQQDARSYQRVPAGFVPVFTENVSRHGSRAATGDEDGQLVLALWEKARKEGALTPLGKSFGPEVRRLLDAMAKVGYGELSERGKQELRDTAVRLRKRLPALFDAMPAKGERIDVVSSGKGRAVDSGTEFAGALVAADPKLAPLVGPARTDADLLYFHKSDGGAAYRDYVDNDQRLAATLKKIREQPRTGEAARGVLRKLFSAGFVDRMTAADRYTAAEAVYSLYAIAPSMRAEGDWHLDRYIAAKDASWFGYLDDAESFYESGPGFHDSDITYRMADVLLDDLFARAEAAESGTSEVGAVLRFTHAEEIMPLAALMKLPGSERPASPSRPYTYADNAWRGSSVAPMASNIQWDVFRKGGTSLVRMLYNEKETAFKTGCRPVSKGSYFYDLDELERCFDRSAAAE
ncbi:histidine-type phosphatase [Streptomyces corynorhini]|uniref:Multiple inositol polyphosphate phosphatase 1 n=1 Tax=Streptomyces corynorhini TaxID=2282652 RepID=A0A370BAL6_9ACTN|nr:histidine-type phosphatase [Streptomyces corynorhini]RDG38671.1 histidine-type phosphatase [Streptomyces corynorhini]